MVDQTDERSLFAQLKALYAQMYRSGSTWEGARVLQAEIPLDVRAVRKILPAGLKPSDPATGSIFVAYYPKTSFNVSYTEAAILINVRTIFGEGVHCPWMLVDDDTALIYGREGLGYPKKLGELTWSEAPNGDITASAVRRGIEVLRIHGRARRALPIAVPEISRKVFNVGGPGQLLAINPIWMFTPKQRLRELYEVSIELTLESSPFDPIAKLVAGPPLRGYFAVADITGTPRLIPVGVAGLRYFANTSTLRFK